MRGREKRIARRERRIFFIFIFNGWICEEN